MEKFSGSMIFIDECLSDDCRDIIQIMMSHHASKNYKDLRNIILGYNSKTGKWTSRYGEILAKKDIAKIESVCFSPISTDNFVKIGGMIFYEEDVFDSTKIYIDDAVKCILDTLFTISENVINYRYITDIIVTEWNIKHAASIYNNGRSYNIYGELHFRPIEIKDVTWKEFKNTVRRKGLTIRDAFKLAAIDFLESRINITNKEI